MKRLRYTAVALVLVFGAGACGGDDGEGADEDAGLSGAEGTAAAGAEGAGGSDLTLPDEVVPVEGDPAEVVALDNSFNAEGISVPAGTTVRWVNNGRQDHDVIPAGETDASGEWGADPGDFAPGGTYEHTFAEPGTYNYYCTLHGTESAGMVGVVVVE
jgi:plastocyanin